LGRGEAAARSGLKASLLAADREREGDFAPAQAVICVMTLMAVASYVFLVGKIKRIEVGM